MGPRLAGGRPCVGQELIYLKSDFSEIKMNDIPIVPLDVTDEPEKITPVYKSSKAKYILFASSLSLMIICLIIGMSLISRPAPTIPEVGHLIDKYTINETCSNDPCLYMVIKIGEFDDQKYPCYLKSRYDQSIYDSFVYHVPYEYVIDKQLKCTCYTPDTYSKLCASYSNIRQIGSGFLIAIPAIFVTALLIYVCCLTKYEDARRTSFAVFNPTGHIM